MKQALIFAAKLFAVGFLLMLLGVWLYDAPPPPRETNHASTPIEGEFTDIVIEASCSEITVSAYGSGNCYMVYGLEQPFSYTATVENGTLYITENDNRAWYEYFDLNADENWMTLYLAHSSCGTVTVKNASGDVNIDTLRPENLAVETASGHLHVYDTSVTGETKLTTASGDLGVYRGDFGALTVGSTSGDVSILDLTGGRFAATTRSGDVALTNAIAAAKMELTTSSGDIELEKCDADELLLKTSSGDIEGTLLTGKRFDVTTDSGDRDLPASSPSGGLCKITTTSGDVSIQMAQ